MKAKVGASLLQAAFQASGHLDIDILGFTNLGDTHIETTRDDPHASTDDACLLQALTLPTTVKSFISTPPLGGYSLVLRSS